MFPLLAAPAIALRSALATDFSEYALGSITTQGWTTPNAVNFTATIVAASAIGTPISPKAVLLDKTTSNASRFITFDAAGTQTDVEVLARMLFSALPVANGETEPGVVARYTSVVNYYIALLRKITGGSTKVLEIGKEAGSGPVPLANSSIAFDITEFWWIRLRCTGTTVKSKTWRHGASEPASWTVSSVDTSHASGKVGLVCFYVAYNARCDFFSVGIGSNTAPGPGG